jgi:hypothetical protein
MSSAIFACLKNGRIELKCKKVCEMLQKAYGESARKKTVFTSVSKMATKKLKMTNTPVDPARQLSMKKWKKGYE